MKIKNCLFDKCTHCTLFCPFIYIIFLSSSVVVHGGFDNFSTVLILYCRFYYYHHCHHLNEHQGRVENRGLIEHKRLKTTDGNIPRNARKQNGCLKSRKPKSPARPGVTSSHMICCSPFLRHHHQRLFSSLSPRIEGESL